MSADAATLPVDPSALMRSRQYRALLVFAALVGLLVSALAWLFLEAVHALQIEVYTKLPGHLGFDTVPAWWPLPWLALAGLLTAFAIVKLPGRGGHVPADGLKTGGPPTQPIDLPGVVLAAVATLGLGLVLGPESPLIAIGMALGILAMRTTKPDPPVSCFRASSPPASARSSSSGSARGRASVRAPGRSALSPSSTSEAWAGATSGGPSC